MARLIALMTVLGLAAPAAAQPWRYIDKNGAVNYTNNINNLPPKLRKRAREIVEGKKLRAAAKAAAAPATEAVEGAPAVAIPPPAKVAPKSAESTSDEPTAHEKWQARVNEADKAVADLGVSLKKAQDRAQEAQRAALITPSGFNSAAHLKAQDRLKSLEGQLTAAEAARVRTRKAEPPVTK